MRAGPTSTSSTRPAVEPCLAGRAISNGRRVSGPARVAPIRRDGPTGPLSRAPRTIPDASRRGPGLGPRPRLGTGAVSPVHRAGRGPPRCARPVTRNVESRPRRVGCLGPFGSRTRSCSGKCPSPAPRIGSVGRGSRPGEHLRIRRQRGGKDARLGGESGGSWGHAGGGNRAGSGGTFGISCPPPAIECRSAAARASPGRSRAARSGTFPSRTRSPCGGRIVPTVHRGRDSRPMAEGRLGGPGNGRGGALPRAGPDEDRRREGGRYLLEAPPRSRRGGRSSTGAMDASGGASSLRPSASFQAHD